MVEIATPGGAVNGQDERRTLCAAIDRPARSCFMVIKAGKPQGCLPAPFGFWGRGAAALGHFLPPCGGRGTGACIPAAASDSGRIFAPSRSQTSARCPVAQTGCVKATTPPVFPPAAPAGITCYTLQARSCAKGEAQPPFGNPRFCGCVATVRICGPCPHPSKTQRSGADQPTPRADLCRFFVRPPGRDGSFFTHNQSICQFKI